MATEKTMKKMGAAGGGLAAKAKTAGQDVYTYAKAHKNDKGATGDAARAYCASVRRSGPTTKRQGKAAA